MTEKYPGFFTAIFGGRKAKEPEPVKTKKKNKYREKLLADKRKPKIPRKKTVKEESDPVPTEGDIE
jgi:hypothetical protein|tara:strand:- start:1476 stop:1673 length:198 start_codon:yes stop_codon:yes gene_type:complete